MVKIIMEDLNKEELKNKLSTILDQAIEFMSSENYEELKQLMIDLEGKKYDDLSEEDKKVFTNIIDKIPESNIWMILFLMMLNPFGLKDVNIPFQNPVDIKSIHGCGWIDDNGRNFYTTIPEACKNCSNHPSNGGDGICNCILGITPISYDMYNTNYTC